jgi:putative ATP-dependent endonuclease of the OLD family
MYWITGPPDLRDVHWPFPPPGHEGTEELTEVEVTLVDLDAAVEQDLEDRLELIYPATGLPADEARPARR